MIYAAVCIVAFLAVVGVIQIVQGIRRGLQSPEDDEIVIVVPIRARQENAEFLLRRCAQKVRELGAGARAVCLDCGADEETAKVCRLVCRDYPFISICTLGELKGNLIRNS